jgi:MFS family permease
MATFFISAFIILTLKVKEEKQVNHKIHIKEYVNCLNDGISYLKTKPILVYFAIRGVFLNGVLVPFNSLQAPLISEVLHAVELMLSVLGGALTIGMIVGASIYPYISRKLHGYILASMGGYSIGAFYVTFVFVGKYVNSIMIMYIIISVISFFVGIAISLSNSYTHVEFVKNVEEKYLARAWAIMNAACTASIPIVSFIVSVFVKMISTEELFMISGGLSVIICICLCNKKTFHNIVERNVGNDKDNDKMEDFANVKEV